MNIIQNAASLLAESYHICDGNKTERPCKLPAGDTIIAILQKIRRVIFPGYFGGEELSAETAEYFAGHLLGEIYRDLRDQIEIAFRMYTETAATASERAEDAAATLISAIPEIRRLLLADVDAGYNGDPAAKSHSELIVSYPGLLAIFTYRVAHILYKKDVPMIPRIMTEYAHSKTGIDINAGAVIGENFFIDHGTGVVIGETTVIGNNVKLYQGVTLGALSTRSGQELSGVKRHPTIRDNVTIYANSTVLGGETVIGSGVIIGGNAFITESIPDNTKIIVKSPEMIFKGPKIKEEKWEI